MKATWKGTVIADSDDTVYLEGNHYFPPESVNMDLLRDGTREYTCPWKGKSKYHDIVVDGDVNENSAWSYPEPKSAAKEITGHVAFELRKAISLE